ncbi:hypothetical protein HYDPIDRAFT_155393 [Hydnomerulius pinastri MD-312]|uniref:COP9 signalosome complex subunit 3 n=1 Tax=Hydnomerulius pinastri MD-312 TaxID=994086 RepID=A0A0C9VZF8_9AGAM|nr:hypothetical protein HYDPIDRAFT_155393 [Hydnomerulius pinastri MD-312]
MSQPSLPSPPQQPALQSDSNVQQPAPGQAPASTHEGNVSLDNVISIITTATSPSQLSSQLKSFAPKDVREVVLASLLPDGQDPLTVLDMQANTLGIIYILSARMHTTGAPNPPLEYVQEFCKSFAPEQARLAPDRVTLVAKGIPLLAEAAGNLKLAIQPLFDLLARYSPSLSHLTTIHPVFLKTCVSAHQFAAALPVLAHPITTIDLSISDLHYNDNLVYHYAGGMVYAALKRWSEAEELFEICVCSPGPSAAALQMEALKKMILVQLIREGKPTPPPKYIHPALPRLLKGTPYSLFVNAYPQQRAQLCSIVENEQQLFATEKTLGLITQALERAPRWSIRKLTATYLTLHLSDIGQAVGIESEDEVQSLILDMIESSEISAQLSADGTVSFSDPPVNFEKADVDRVLAHAQEQGALLAKLEKEMARSKEYLSKVRCFDSPVLRLRIYFLSIILSEPPTELKRFLVCVFSDRWSASML